MNAPAGHQVKKLLLDVQVRIGNGPSQERAKAIQQRLSAYCRAQLEHALQPCFDEAAGDARIYQIRHIELDLGRVAPGRLELELGERLRSALRDTLRRLGLPRPALAPASGAWQEAEPAYWDALLAWLERGAVEPDREPAGLLQQAMLHAPARLAWTLRRSSRRAELSERMATALPEPAVEQLVGVLVPGEAAYIVGYARQLRRVQHAAALSHLDRPGFGTTLWAFILNYLIDSRGSEFNRRAFVAATLRKMAARYQLEFDELCAQLTGAAERLRTREGRIGGLLDTLYELRLQPPAFEVEPAPFSAATADLGVTVLEPDERQLQWLTALLQGRADRHGGHAGGVLEYRLDELARQQPAVLQAALRTALRSGDARRRLLRGLSPEGRRRLWQWLVPAQARRIVRLLGALRHALQSGSDAQLDVRLDEAALGCWTTAPAVIEPAAFARGVLSRYANAQPRPARAVLHQLDSGDVSFGKTRAQFDERRSTTPGERLQHWLRHGVWHAAEGRALHDWLAGLPDLVIVRAAMAVGPVAAGRIARETAPAWRERLLRLLAGDRADALIRLRAGLPAAARRLRESERGLLRLADVAWLPALLDADASAIQPSDWSKPLAEALALHTLRDYREMLAAIEGAIAGHERRAGSTGQHPAKRATGPRRAMRLLRSRTPHRVGRPVRLARLPQAARGDRLELAQLVALLENGTPPPWGTEAQYPQRSFQRLLARQPEPLLGALRKAMLHPGALARLLRWLPAATRRQLLLTLTPSIGGLVLTWLHAGSALADNFALTGSQRRQADSVHWEVALSLLFRPHGDAFSAASFLRDATRQVAHRLRLPHAQYRQLLLAVASRGAGGETRYAVLVELLAGEHAADLAPAHVPEPAGEVPVHDEVHDGVPDGVGWTALPANRDGPVLAALEDTVRYGHSLTQATRADLAERGAALGGWPPARRRLWRRFFRQACKEPLQRRRLASLLPPALLLRLLPIWLTPPQIEVVKPLLERVAKLAALRAHGRHDAQALAWDALLEQIGGGQGSRWSAPLFLTALAKRVAELHELAPLTFLAALERSLPSSSAGAREAVRQARRISVVDTFPRPSARSAPGIDPRQPLLPDAEPMYVDNAGLVLLWPFLTRYFEILGLVDNSVFVNEAARSRAVYLLQYLACGTTDAPEHALTLNKLLCGMPFAQAPEFVAPPAEEEKRIGRDLLYAVTQRWEKLKHTSVEGLQETFLLREGRLLCEQDKATLTLSPKTVDILLDSLPWSIGTIRLPWLQQVLFVKWR